MTDEEWQSLLTPAQYRVRPLNDMFPNPDTYRNGTSS
jgi:hypothetical protein